MWNLKKWYKWTYLQNKETHKHRKQIYSYQRGKRVGGQIWSLWVADTNYYLQNWLPARSYYVCVCVCVCVHAHACMCIYTQGTIFNILCCCCSVTQLGPTLIHGLQHARLPCPLPSPRVCLNSCPLRQWNHPTTSSSVIPFSFCLQSFPASGSFPMRWLFTSGGQSIGISASASVLSMNIQGWFPLGLTGLISLLSKGLSRVFSSTAVQKHQFFGA